MKIINLKRYLYRFAPVLIILVGILLSGIYLASDPSESTRETFSRIFHGLIMTAGLWTGCIIIVTWLWKKYPWQEAPMRHLLYEILLIFIFTVTFGSIVYLVERSLFNNHQQINLVYDAFVTLLITYFITAIHEAVFFYRQWSLHFSKSVKLEKENIEANYFALKNQVNPHFIFNSLNSLTGLVDDNSEAVNYIANLSGFLRYLLNNDEKELVSLEEELDVVNRYFALQKSRFGDAINMEIKVDTEIQKKYLPPLALQMLVENCLKHNVATSSNPLNIQIYSHGGRILVENNLNLKKETLSTKKGIKNIQERYSLFSREQLKINQNSERYLVSLPLLNIEL
jgi:sensor histidine kinase YesM